MVLLRADRGLAAFGRGNCTAGVADQNIDPAKGLDCGIDRRLHLRFITDIGDHADAAPAQSLDLCRYSGGA